MGGTSSGTSQQQFQQQSQPWAPTQPELQSILNQIPGLPSSVTPQQTGALNTLQNNAGGLPNFGGAVTGLVGNQLSGIPNLNGLISNAYGASSNALNPYLQSNFLNPGSNPYTGQAINTLNQDLTNQIQGQFAGAGQGMGPAEAQALARGLSQGEGGLLMNQFNANAGLQQGAAQQLMNSALGANNAYGGNAQSGIGNIGAIPGATNLSPLSSLAASQLAQQLPLSLLGGVEGLTLPIAGLGGQTSGSQSGQTSNTMSGAQQFGTIAGGVNSLFGGGGGSAAGNVGTGSSNLLKFLGL